MTAWERYFKLDWTVEPEQDGSRRIRGYISSQYGEYGVYGLAAVFLTILLESAGVPLPGETALIAASVLASQGSFSLLSVIVVAAAAGIIGDNAGYWIGRTAGRQLLMRWRPVARYMETMLPSAERFFVRHGGKAVFLARFVFGLRVIGALVAGIAGMEWWRFLAWNAAGAVAWATSVALVAYWLGETVAKAVGRYGVLGGAVVIVVAAVLYRLLHGLHRSGID